MQFQANQIAALVGGSIEGDGAHAVSAIAKIEEADIDALSFIANPKYEWCAGTTRAGILLVNRTLEVNNSHVKAVIRVNDPYAAFTQLLTLYQQMMNAERKTGMEQPVYISASSTHDEGLYLGAFAYVSDHVKLGRNVSIYPHVFIGENVEIGHNTIVHSGVKIYAGCKIGSNCVLHAGVVIGGDGFGFAPKADGRFQKIPQTGIVVIGDDVEIGANTVIDRATIGKTSIGNGVKLDNLVHIAHNVEIGEDTVIAAQTGISGSTKIGKQVMIGGQVGMVGHIKIADGVKINAQSGVSKSILTENAAVTGSPAMAFREHYKQLAYLRRIPELLEWLKKNEKNQF
ncbi:MAG: UDP-3-O-(3-hydroxymyristoyl)glucosamine N-acyltransferase [Chitinophagales bacterium]